GGGTVFLPAGDYRLKGPLKVPSGVELRGVHDVPHHTAGGGSVLHVFEAGGEPTIVLGEQSGLRGLGFNYPEQRASNIQPFPFLIQGRGSDIYVINVNASNPYQFIDFMTYRCDRHYIDYASGAPLKSGILVGGGSQDGIVMNMQFNPHYWTRTPSRHNPLYAGSPSGGINRRTGAKLWEFQKENLDALVVGDSAGQFLFQNFVFGSLYGMRFIEQKGRGAIDCLVHGHGTDGSKVGVFFEHGQNTITMINSELVAMASEDKIAIKIGPDFGSEALLINTMVWGEPDLLAEIADGSLILQNMHANRHGDGIDLSGGRLLGYNLSFNSPGNYLDAFEGAQVKLVGVVTEGPSALSMARPDFDLLIKRN
ncbi:MAG: S-layer protein, partial [Verrucomicrobiota bacterium]